MMEKEVIATSTENWLKLEVGQAFVRAHQSEVIGVLRGHGLIAKVPNTHRYAVTGKGRRIVIALLTARQASAEKLTAMAG